MSIALSVLTLAVVFAYTYYEKRAADITKEGEERAWVLIGEDRLTLSDPKFYHFRQHGFGMPDTDGFGMGVDFPMTVSNVGKKLANRHSVFAELVADTEKLPHWGAPWGEWWEHTCDIAEGNMQGTSEMSENTPLLPGTTSKTASAVVDFVPAEPQYIRSVYIVGCVTYREMNGDIHFTAITYCPSTFNRHPTKVLDDPEVFYDRTDTTFWACNHEAD